MLIDLAIILFNRLGIIVLFAFIISKSKITKKILLQDKLDIKTQIIIAICFGLGGIVATYWGVDFYGAIVNSRSIAIVLSGILGGPIVGLIAGVIAGIHRMFLESGQLTALACGLSTIIGGLIGGLFKKTLDSQKDKWLFGFMIGILVEAIQMAMILLIARPFSEALEVVKYIFIPMMFINSIGISIFLAIFQQIYSDREVAGAVQAQLALVIATKTLPYFRKGLNEDSAIQAARIIKDVTNIDAVAFTNKEKILAHVGVGEDHHKSGSNLSTNITKKAITQKQVMIANNSKKIECDNKGCNLKSAIIAPLYENNDVIGTLKLYKIKTNSVTKTDIELAKGLAHLFSNQIELSKIEYQKELIKRAELKRLQAQIRPHFLFNTLNTVVSFCRTNPNKARDLLLELSFFLRSSFNNIEELVTLEQEIRITNSYLSIIKARFGDKVLVEYDIDLDQEYLIPPFIIEPLVENAVKHGILPLNKSGLIKVTIRKNNQKLEINISDTGVGMNQDLLDSLLKESKSELGIGIKNVNQRLESLYQESLEIKSKLNVGTSINFKVPLMEVIDD